MIRVPTEEELTEGNKRWQLSVGIDPNRKSPAPINMEAVRSLGATATLLWAGKLYDVPPVPFLEAVQLDALRRRLYEMPDSTDAEDELIAWKILLNEFGVLFRGLVQPRGFVARWRWRHSRYNPFAKISPHEVGQLISFFSVCRTMSRFGNIENSSTPTLLRKT